MRTKIFWSGNSQAVRLPRAFRFDEEVSEVNLRREGDQLILEPVRPKHWPESFWQAFGEMPEDFERPEAHHVERESFDP